MPYKSEKLRLTETQDRRRKLTNDQKEEIKRIYKSGVCGTRPLAKKFGVSRKTIQLIVNPTRLCCKPLERLSSKQGGMGRNTEGT